MIERNRNPVGRAGNLAFGLATLLDGLVRVVSLGWLHTRFPVALSGWQTKRYLAQVKAQRTAKIVKKG